MMTEKGKAVVFVYGSFMVLPNSVTEGSMCVQVSNPVLVGKVN